MSVFWLLAACWSCWDHKTEQQEQAPVGNSNQPDLNPTKPTPSPVLLESLDQTPNSEGPFVEPPLDKRPGQLYVVVVGTTDRLDEAERLSRQVAAKQFVSVGYPAVDQSRGLLGRGKKWAVLAGKFMRESYAQALSAALSRQGLAGVEVVACAYRHDRFRPAAGLAEGIKAGQVFAGFPGVELPLLARPSRNAKGNGAVKDGRLVEVDESIQAEDDGTLWYRLRHEDRVGFLQASRVLLDHNIFPDPTGKKAVLGVQLGCGKETCRWDYWLVTRGYSKRILLANDAPRLPHNFSPDGKVLAYTVPGRQLSLAFEQQGAEISLGPGTSPAWSPDGKSLYFRRPGLHTARDQVVMASSANWKVETVLDFPGQPFYPKTLSLIPPRVDILHPGPVLYTMFYRLSTRLDQKTIFRWKVWFRPDGSIVRKTAEQITE